MNDNLTQNHPDEWLFHELLDGELPPSDEVQFRLHISGCEQCQSRLQELSSLFQSIQRLPDLALQHDISTVVEQRISAQQRSARKFPNPSLLVYVFQAIAVTVILLVSKNTLATFIQPVISRLLNFQGEVHPWLWLVSRWEIIIDPYRDGLAILLQSFQAPDLSVLSQYPLTLILAAASILWLTGNGILFWNTNLTRRNP